MHVIFDRNHVTVRNVQAAMLLLARLVAGLYWTVAVLSSDVDALLAVDSLSLLLTDVAGYARLTVSTN